MVATMGCMMVGPDQSLGDYSNGGSLGRELVGGSCCDGWYCMVWEEGQFSSTIGIYFTVTSIVPIYFLVARETTRRVIVSP